MSRNFELACRIGEEQGTILPEPSSPFAVSAFLDEKRVNGVGYKASSPLQAEIQKLIQVLFLASANGPHHVVFCGVGADDGSGSVCVSVAKGLSNEVTGRVCLVDAKILGPTLQQSLDVEEDVFPFSDTIEQSGSIARQIDRNLWSVSAERLSSVRISNTAPMSSGVLELRKEFGYLIVHAPPLGTDTMAAVLGKVTDGVVLVLEANTTRRVTARSAKEALEAASVRLLGTVLNNRTFPIPEKLYRRL